MPLACRHRQKSVFGLPVTRPDNHLYIWWSTLVLCLDLTYSAFVVGTIVVVPCLSCSLVVAVSDTNTVALRRVDLAMACGAAAGPGQDHHHLVFHIFCNGQAPRSSLSVRALLQVPISIGMMTSFFEANWTSILDYGAGRGKAAPPACSSVPVTCLAACQQIPL